MEENGEALVKRAEMIRDERRVESNTSNRIGQFLVDMLKWIDTEGVGVAKRAISDKNGYLIDANYFTKVEAKEITPVLLSESEYEAIVNKNPKRIYYVYEEEEDV